MATVERIYYNEGTGAYHRYYIEPITDLKQAVQGLNKDVLLINWFINTELPVSRAFLMGVMEFYQQELNIMHSREVILFLPSPYSTEEKSLEEQMSKIWETYLQDTKDNVAENATVMIPSSVLTEIARLLQNQHYLKEQIGKGI